MIRDAESHAASRLDKDSQVASVSSEVESRTSSCPEKVSGHPEEPSARADLEPELCDEQAEIIELIQKGRNVFFTGSAGCGKSTVTRVAVQRLRAQGKKVHILAPTGRAALQIDGVTTWVYAGWIPDDFKKSLVQLRKDAHGNVVWKRFTTTDVLFIDEISMVDNHHFERLNEIMKDVRCSRGKQPEQDEVTKEIGCEEEDQQPEQDEIMKQIRCEGENQQPEQAFGGVQVIVTGDFCQLPPVKPFEYCIECGKELIPDRKWKPTKYTCRDHGVYRDVDKWAFKSRAWDECRFVHRQLKKIHRQSDREFIGMLQKCRLGVQLSLFEARRLLDHPCDTEHATKLLAVRRDVAEINQAEFDKLPGLVYQYWCKDKSVWQAHHPHLRENNTRFWWSAGDGPKCPRHEQPDMRPLKALREHRFDECVEIKEGMLVLLLINLDLEQGLCNGSMGVVVGFEDLDEARLPRTRGLRGGEPATPLTGKRAAMRQAEIAHFAKTAHAQYKKWPVVRFHGSGIVRTVYPACSVTEQGDTEPYSLLGRTQVPLAPAWAMTIHKSQSLTLQRVEVHPARVFAEGQLYVALSRATGLGGLRVVARSPAELQRAAGALGANDEVRRFMREHFGALNARS